MKHQEYELQKSICNYLELQFPTTLFLSDTVASVKLSIPQSVRNAKIQKKGFKCPDLLILEPRHGFHGLFLELKTETPYKKDGNIKASQNDHLKNQEFYLRILAQKGYFAQFAWTFDMAKEFIDDYMSDIL